MIREAHNEAGGNSGGGTLTEEAGQRDLFETYEASKGWQQFLKWKATPGAGKVMESYYRYAGGDFLTFGRTGVRTSARFIEERTRRDIRHGKRLGCRLDGYALNSHVTKPILIHMLREHPEWSVMFLQRELKPRKQRKITVTETVN